MRLTINDEEVSYSLENERTLGEVVHGVRSWLAAAGFVITGLRADERDLLASPAESWGDAGVAATRTLGVTATHTGDMRIAHWRTVERWLSMLEEEILRPAAGPESARHESASDPLEELLAGLPQTIEGFAANPFMPRGSDSGKAFEATFSGQGASQVRSWPQEKRNAAAGQVRSLRAMVQARIDSATHPAESLARCAEQIRASRDGLNEVSVLLQTGRDKAAMEIVIMFTDVVQSLMDLLPFLAPDPERVRLLAELTPFLREMVGAFGSRDTVLIGDLLEYEIAPRMERLAPLLEKKGSGLAGGAA